jgi:vacuolar-type H+-ATPase subunit I/STV1
MSHRRFTRTPHQAATLNDVSAPDPAHQPPSPPRRRSTVTTEIWLWAGIATAICTALFGGVYWTTDYNDLDIGSISLALYLVAMVPVAVLRATRTAPFVLAAATLPAGLVLAVIMRIAVDVGQDPTSHNLWPIEIFIAGIVGVFWGAIGAAIGEVVLRLRSH